MNRVVWPTSGTLPAGIQDVPNKWINYRKLKSHKNINAENKFIYDLIAKMVRKIKGLA